nr:MAG TPA: hypothetical protein [Caudoviricetes sp.]
MCSVFLKSPDEEKINTQADEEPTRVINYFGEE